MDSRERERKRRKRNASHCVCIKIVCENGNRSPEADVKHKNQQQCLHVLESADSDAVQCFCFDLNFTDYGSFGSVSFSFSLSLVSAQQLKRVSHFLCAIYVFGQQHEEETTQQNQRKNLLILCVPEPLTKFLCLSFFGCNDAYFCMLVNLQSNSISMSRGCAAHKQHDHLRMP